MFLAMACIAHRATATTRAGGRLPPEPGKAPAGVVESSAIAVTGGSRSGRSGSGRRLELQIAEYALGGFPPFPHRGDHQVRAAGQVATGEHLGIRGLAGMAAAAGKHAIAVIGRDAELLEPGRRTRPEAEGDDDAVGVDDLLAAGDRFRHSPAAPVGGAESGGDHPDAGDTAIADDLDGLAIP